MARISLFGCVAYFTIAGQNTYSASANAPPSGPNNRFDTHHNPPPSQIANSTNGSRSRYFTNPSSCRASHVVPFKLPFAYSLSAGLRK